MRFDLDRPLINYLIENYVRNCRARGADVCQGLSFFIASPDDVLQLAAFKFAFHQIIHLAVRDHVVIERIAQVHRLLYEEFRVLIDLQVQAFAMRIPCNRASYPASLFVGSGKFICITYFILSPCGDMRTTPAPAPMLRFEPWRYMVQEPDVSGVAGV
jgi:hypothetical protein